MLASPLCWRKTKSYEESPAYSGTNDHADGQGAVAETPSEWNEQTVCQRGVMCEWLKQAVLKAAMLARASEVRIFLTPPQILTALQRA
jgi:hypothetical protein